LLSLIKSKEKQNQNMRRILPSSLLLATIALSTTVIGQNDRFTFAITDATKSGTSWNTLRKLDLKTGEYTSLIANGNDMNSVAYDAVTKKPVVLQDDARYGKMVQAPFVTGVAAAAYDKKNNRLYFTPMFIDQLRYVDLKTMKVYYVTAETFSKKAAAINDEASVITRMVIAPDGNGYAISNDGNSFIRFTTGKRTVIEQLGSLVDAPSNNGISVHNKCTSFGGDMVSDDAGNLYILSARNQVFRVNTETKVATYLGGVKELPANFTINGAVVDADGSLLVSSAVDGTGYYTVNPKNWTASPFTATTDVYRSSDLANSNFLASPKTQTRPELQNVQLNKVAPGKFSKNISVYPNPVVDNNVVISFSRVPNGDYTIELTDVLGRTVQQSRITIVGEDQTQTLKLAGSNTKGTYLLRVVDRDLTAVFTQKVLVQ
jgi:hypothetical protein